MAASPGPKVGINGAVLRNSGSYGTPTLAEIELIRDVTPAFPWDMGDASTRTSRAKLYAKTQVDFQIQVVCRMDDSDTGFQLLYDAAMSPTTVLDLHVLDGPVTEEGAAGVRFHALVSLTGESQGVGDVQYATFELKPGYSSDGVPKVVDVGASSVLAYTAV